MKSITIALSLVYQVTSLSYLMSIGPGGSKPVNSMTLSGPNQEYLVQGSTTTFHVYSINWVDTSAIEVKEVALAADVNLIWKCRICSDKNHNIVLASKTVMRFSAEPGKPNNPGKYVPVSQEGFDYDNPVSAMNTNYLFLCTQSISTASKKKFYRLNAELSSDVQEFPLGANSRAYGVFEGTTLVLASDESGAEGKIFDYTNGHDGGTNSVLATHPKPSSAREIAFLSPGDARGYYVITDSRDGPTRSIFTVKDVDGSQHLSYDLSGLLTQIVSSLSWIYDTNLCLVASYKNGIMLVDLMDNTRPLSFLTYPAGMGVTAQIGDSWLDKRAVVISATEADKSLIYKVPIADQPCSELCSTCHEIFRKSCLTCQPNASVNPDGSCSCNFGYYENKISFSRKECRECSALCGTCSGPGSTHCLSCKDPNMDHLGDGSCRCKEGFYLSGSACLPCHSSCASCYGGLETNCLSCSQPGAILQGSTCVDPTIQPSPVCPEETRIKVLPEIQNSVQNLTIEFSPSLKAQLSDPAQETLLNAENLVKNNFKITFGNDEGSQTPLKVIKANLRHSETPESRSFLFIKYLQKIKSLNSSGYLNILVTNRWVYQPQPGQQQQNGVCFKDFIQIIKVTDQIKSSDEKSIERAEAFGLVFSALFYPLIAVLTGRVAFCFGKTKLLVLIIKLFNILDVVSNLGKINVNFGVKIQAALAFIDKIEIPEINFLASLSPLRDREWDSKDSSAYQTLLRGSRGKVTTSNKEVFLGSGQSFIISLLIITFGVCVIPVLSVCLNKNSRILRIFSVFYQTLIGIFFYDFQRITVTEIAMTDYSRISKLPFRFWVSLVLSMCLLVVILFEIFRA